MKKYTLIQNNDYTIEEMNTSSWHIVKLKRECIALTMNIETARQVIFKDLTEKETPCEYLYESDFTTKEI